MTGPRSTSSIAPRPLTERTHDWRERASCVGLQDLFIDDVPEDPGTLDTMRRCCQACPVRQECAAVAVEMEDSPSGIVPVGVWAGHLLLFGRLGGRGRREREAALDSLRLVAAGVAVHERSAS